MRFSLIFRDKVNDLPIEVGRYFRYLPNEYRPGIGKSYRRTLKDIRYFGSCDIFQRKQILLQQVKDLTKSAYNSIPFYRKIYDDSGFNPTELRNFEDIKKIPIIRKSDLMQWSIEDRTFLSPGAIEVNTGGSSGKPLSLYIPPEKFGIELAHSYHLRRLQLPDYKMQDLRLMFTGRSNIRELVDYDFKRNALKVDIYAEWNLVSKRLLSRFKKEKIKVIQGYPSAIYDFAMYCRNDKKLLSFLRKSLRGVFLNSEYPYPYQRRVIEKIFNVRTFAFYGHTEGCVLAYESHPNIYHPLHSYGFVEAIEIDGNHRLIGTNLYNSVSPLIRYDTEDYINCVKEEEDLLTQFSIKEGRKGEYVIDNKNKQIPLTGLVFGRHHKLFDVTSSVQVKQIKPGIVKILYVTSSGFPLNNPIEYFDDSNVDIKFFFEHITGPIRTPAGKVKLLL